MKKQESKNHRRGASLEISCDWKPLYYLFAVCIDIICLVSTLIRSNWYKWCLMQPVVAVTETKVELFAKVLFYLSAIIVRLVYVCIDLCGLE